MLKQKIFTQIVRLSFVDLRWAQLYVSLVSEADIFGWSYIDYVCADGGGLSKWLQYYIGWDLA